MKYFLIFLCLFESSVFATTSNLSVIHTSGSDLTIASGDIVIIDTSTTLKDVVINGELKCSSTQNPYWLNVKKITINNGGKLTCGTSGSRYTKKLTLNFNQGSDRTIHVKGGGELNLFGSRKTTHVRLNENSTTSKLTYSLSATPVGWKENDNVVVTTTSMNPYLNEVVALNSDINSNQMVLKSALSKYHNGSTEINNSVTLDARAYVANLDRNILIRSSNSSVDGDGVMIKVMRDDNGAGVIHLDSVAIENGGTRTKMGEYPIHWHQAGIASGQYVKYSVIKNSKNRCVVIHDTDQVTVEQNVCFDHFGHGFFLENGTERNNTITRNIVIMSKGIPSGSELLISELSIDFAGGPKPARFPGPSAYWISNPFNIVTYNVSVGSQGTGFWMAFTDDHLNGANGGGLYPIHTRTPANYFASNTAMSNRVGFTWDGAPKGPVRTATNNDHGINSHNANDRLLEPTHYDPRVDANNPSSGYSHPTFNSIKAFKSSEAGIYFRGSPATFDSALLADNRWSLFLAYSQKIQNSNIFGKSNNFHWSNVSGYGSESSDYSFMTNNGYLSSHGTGGIVVYDGPFELNNVTFHLFPVSSSGRSYLSQDQTLYPIINIGGQKRFINKVVNVDFSPTPLKKVVFNNNSEWKDTAYNLSIDDDGSLTGLGADRLIVYNSGFNNVNVGGSSVCSTDTTNFTAALVCNYKIMNYEFEDFANFETGNGTCTGGSPVCSDPNSLNTRFTIQKPGGSEITLPSGGYMNKFNAVINHSTSEAYIVGPTGNFASASRFRVRATSTGLLSGSQEPARVFIEGKTGCIEWESRGDITEATSWSQFANATQSAYFPRQDGLYVKIFPKWTHPLHTNGTIMENQYIFDCD